MPSVRTVPAPLQAYFADYASFHQTPLNRLSHYIGVPVLIVAIAGLLAQITLGPADQGAFRPDLGLAAWAACTAFYVVLDWRIALPFSALLFGGYWLGRDLPPAALWSLFAVGWICQLAGHRYEGSAPAFVKNFQHLLIGPLWLFAKAIGYPH